MSSNLRRGPERIGAGQIDLNQAILAKGLVMPDEETGTRQYFSKCGRFRVKNFKDYANPLVKPSEVWSNKLLECDSEADRIKTSKNGWLWVFRRADDEHLATMPPQAIRIVDGSRSGPVTVGETGFLLHPTGIYKLGGREMGRKKFEEILAEAAIGKTPFAFANDPYMRVDTKEVPPGTAVEQIFIQAEPLRERWKMDGVVVLANRTLARREITHPLYLGWFRH